MKMGSYHLVTEFVYNWCYETDTTTFSLSNALAGYPSQEFTHK